MKQTRWLIISGALLALLSVILGAFSAHALKSLLDDYSLGLFKTASSYQMYHALALITCGLLSLNRNFSGFWLKLSGLSFILGTFLFSGSLYLLAISGIKWLGAITPLGGLGFIIGWTAMSIAVYKGADEKS